MKNVRKAIITSRRHCEWFISQAKPDSQKEKKDESQPKTT